MTRPPVTVAILAWNAWEATRACLDSLRPTLGVRDQVVVVDNGSRDATAAGLKRYPWVQVVTNPVNRGFAGGCNDAAAAARHDIIVFLNNDTLLAPRWADPLVAALEDPAVGAAGPRSNFVSGPQVVEGTSYSDTSGMRRFARDWAQAHRGSMSDTSRLVGFCLAVRRSAFERVGGFDEGYGIGGYEDDDLCQRLTKAGYRLVIAHQSFVHHDGHKTFDANGLDWYAEQEGNRQRFLAAHDGGAPRTPLVSGCLITKDEEANLAACVESLRGVADEVVIYDTGSGDGTVALARSLGAEVIEGYWDDDFSRARNAALERCRGEWVAWLDADETLVVSDPSELRRLLVHTDHHLDAWSVPIHNLTGSGAGAGFVHHASRLFRRARCEWSGRLHEQVTIKADHSGVRQARLEMATIRHTGYLDEVMRARGKAARNLRVAQAEVDRADGWEKAFSLTSLARSFLTVGQMQEAHDRAAEALLHTDNPITRRLALRTCVEALVGLGRLDDALAACGRLRAESSAPDQGDLWEAKVRLAGGNHRRALQLLEALPPSPVDEDGVGHSSSTIAQLRAEALAGLGRPGEAADLLIAGLFEEGSLDTHLGTVVDLLREAGRPLDDLAAAIPAERAPLFLAQVLQLQPPTADDTLEACLAAMADGDAVLAAAASLARRLPIDRALVWSARLRAAGHQSACPLLAVAASSAPPVQRARAAATAMAAFSDPRSAELFRAAFDAAAAPERRQIRAEAAQLCPALLEGMEAPAPPAGPRVSIVIPCFNQAALTLACLQSLQQNTDRSLFEVVVVDNGSTDATAQLQSAPEGRFRVIRNRANEGFGRACNQGAEAAACEYVLFLNNDTVVLQGWLEPLVAALDGDPALAAVQPRLVFPDGRLNDAGGLVFQGGEPWVYGKGHPDPTAPQFSCRRAPDYASGACLLVRRSAFHSVGGFDSRYHPAYFEDTDLSFALRSQGWKVLYEPASTIVHVEGGTAGRDVTTGLKSYQVRNGGRFAEKWEEELAGRPAADPAGVEDWAHRPQGGYGAGEASPGGLSPAVAAKRAAAAKRILVADLTMPLFDRASGGLRTFNLLRCLREVGHSVSYYAVGGGDRRYADAVGAFGVTCYGGNASRAGDPAYRSDYFPSFAELLSRRRFDMVIISPWTLGETLVGEVRRHAPEATIVLDTNDVHFLRLERAAALSGSAADRLAATETRQRELAVYAAVDRMVAVSDADADVIRAALPDPDVLVIPNVHGAADPGPGFTGRSGCVFVANFNHLPNRDALEWWTSSIAPLLPVPNGGLTVVGNDPEGFASRRAGPGVAVTGAVASTLPYLHQVLVSVAPLRYGAGMKGKVGEAMAAGLPVVATSIAAEGMGLVPGRHFLLADTPEEFAAAVSRLQGDEGLWNALRDAGRAHVEEHFGPDRMRRGVDLLVAAQGAAPSRR